MLCIMLGQCRDEAERHWALMRAELIAVAEEPNVSGSNLRRVAEIEARIATDLATRELEQHQRVHTGAN